MGRAPFEPPGVNASSAAPEQPADLKPNDFGNGDGVCDTDDVCPGSDDGADGDGDGEPDGCDPGPVELRESLHDEGVVIPDRTAAEERQSGGESEQGRQHDR